MAATLFFVAILIGSSLPCLGRMVVRRNRKKKGFSTCEHRWKLISVGTRTHGTLIYECRLCGQAKIHCEVIPVAVQIHKS